MDVGWQKCPICDGTGQINSYSNTSSIYGEQCTTCNGKKIINTLTGLPPAYTADGSRIQEN